MEKETMKNTGTRSIVRPFARPRDEDKKDVGGVLRGKSRGREIGVKGGSERCLR